MDQRHGTIALADNINSLESPIRDFIFNNVKLVQVENFNVDEISTKYRESGYSTQLLQLYDEILVN